MANLVLLRILCKIVEFRRSCVITLQMTHFKISAFWFFQMLKKYHFSLFFSFTFFSSPLKFLRDVLINFYILSHPFSIQKKKKMQNFSLCNSLRSIHHVFGTVFKVGDELVNSVKQKARSNGEFSIVPKQLLNLAIWLRFVCLFFFFFRKITRAS